MIPRLNVSVPHMLAAVLTFSATERLVIPPCSCINHPRLRACSARPQRSLRMAMRRVIGRVSSWFFVLLQHRRAGQRRRSTGRAVAAFCRRSSRCKDRADTRLRTRLLALPLVEQHGGAAQRCRVTGRALERVSLRVFALGGH
ncbi:hypothetical protein OH76DRAFT_1262713 [Lentinus brumalis]|uniref:Uncharacterized protein n=1 Tax=Lentinus brumalis TaxID=2498619 RepID=A0A371CRB1_9APHY|nr:hypothetical protein OH76DRAFT_1262713 [Polyporus brumalis]